MVAGGSPLMAEQLGRLALVGDVALRPRLPVEGGEASRSKTPAGTMGVLSAVGTVGCCGPYPLPLAVLPSTLLCFVCFVAPRLSLQCLSFSWDLLLLLVALHPPWGNLSGTV